MLSHARILQARRSTRYVRSVQRLHCYDNAVAESFFSSLKREMDGADNMESWAGANISIGEYIDGFYNLQRRHSAISYESPIESNCYIP